MKQIYTAQEMANYIVGKCIDDGFPIDNFKLQQLLWILQVDHLATYHTPIISDSFQAWRFGPVISDVYYHFCGYGLMKICHVFGARYVDPDDVEQVNGVISVFGQSPYYAVMDVCCPESGAWSKTYKRGEGEKEIISFQLMQEDAKRWGA